MLGWDRRAALGGGEGLKVMWWALNIENPPPQSCLPPTRAGTTSSLPAEGNGHQGLIRCPQDLQLTMVTLHSLHLVTPKIPSAVAFTFLQESSVLRGPGVLSHPLNFSDDSLSRFRTLCSK